MRPWTLHWDAACHLSFVATAWKRCEPQPVSYLTETFELACIGQASLPSAECVARTWIIAPASAEIGRHDILDRLRCDVELRETRQGSARHVVHLEQVDLAGGKRRIRQEFEQPRLDLSHREGYRHEQPPMAHDAQRD